MTSQGDANVFGAFSEEDATKLSGVTQNQLRLWDSNGVLEASFARKNRRQPYSRVYSFRDIVSLRVLNILRNRFGVSGQHLRQVAMKLGHFGDKKWTATTLYVLGKRVVFDDPDTEQRREVVSDQQVFDIPLRAAISDTLQAIRDQNARSEEEKGHVVQKKFVLSNQEVFDGTRVPVSAVVNYLRRGASERDILAEYPDLTAKDIAAAKALHATDAA